MRAMRCLLAAVLAAGIVTVVAAQPGGNRFGGGGGGNVDTLVFTSTAVQEDLKLTDSQKEKFKPIAEKLSDLNKKRSEMFKGGGGKAGKGNFDKEKVAEIQEEGKKVAEEAKKVRDEVLTDAQKKRLHQISIQVMDFTVFNNPEAKGGGGGGKTGGGFGGVSETQKEIMKEVQETLKLTDPQKSSVKTIVADFNKERQEINKEAGITRGGGGGGGNKQADPEKVDAANKKIDKIRKETWGKIEEALDDTQKKAWKDLVGDAFDTSKLRPVAPKKD